VPTLLDVLAEMFPDSSRTTLRQMLQHGRVRVDGEIEKDAKRAIAGENVDVAGKSMQRKLPPGIDIAFEDEHVIVVIKANGITTVQAYLNVYLKALEEERIQVVHRLDRETSGVLVFAKHLAAREGLKEQFAAHSVDRMYVAVVEGALEPPRGTFRSHLFERRDLRMVSVSARPGAKLAITHYDTVKKNDRYSMLEVRLETGRKNQIRVHLSEAKHPIIGDQFYGSTLNPIERLGLHAKLLGFIHPMTGKKLTFTAPVPKSFRDLFM
jgi:RluA family pseudouridine synthase